jgi:hypothetical protein
MNGRRYYMTTIGDWQNHAGRFSNSHWLALQDSFESSTPIIVLIEADEGVHLALEDDQAFEPLPHPLAQKPISAEALNALAIPGLSAGATTYEAAEAVGRIHPLLRHRVF